MPVDLGVFIVGGEPVFSGVLHEPGEGKPETFDSEIEDDFKDTATYDRKGTVKQWAASDALEDVGVWADNRPHLVVACGGRFFAKVEVALSNSEAAIRCMYLYCAGWRRRTRGNDRSGPRSAEIVWHFAARAAMHYFGCRGRVLVIMPREGVYSALQAQGAVALKLADGRLPDYLFEGGLILKAVDPDAIPLRLSAEEVSDWDGLAAELNMWRLLQLTSALPR